MLFGFFVGSVVLSPCRVVPPTPPPTPPLVAWLFLQYYVIGLIQLKIPPNKKAGFYHHFIDELKPKDTEYSGPVQYLLKASVLPQNTAGLEAELALGQPGGAWGQRCSVVRGTLWLSDLTLQMEGGFPCVCVGFLPPLKLYKLRIDN